MDFACWITAGVVVRASVQTRAAARKSTRRAANRWWERLLRNKPCWNNLPRAISRAASTSPGQWEEPGTSAASRKQRPGVAAREGLCTWAVPGWSWEQEHWLLAMPRAASEASQLPQGMGRAQAWFCWEWPSYYWNLPESGSKPEWDAARRGFSMADTNALIFQRSLVASLEWAGTSRGNGIMFPSLAWIF